METENDSPDELEIVYPTLSRELAPSRTCATDDTVPLRTFALIVFAHPYCARNSCRNVTPRHASSARAEKTFQTNTGLVAVAITSLAVYSLK